jgi:hypothetical protein
MAAGVPRVPSPPGPDLASRGTDSSPSGSCCPRLGPIADRGTSGCWAREPGPPGRYRRPDPKRTKPARSPPTCQYTAEPTVSFALPSPSPKNGRPAASPLDVEAKLHAGRLSGCDRVGCVKSWQVRWLAALATVCSGQSYCGRTADGRVIRPEPPERERTLAVPGKRVDSDRAPPGGRKPLPPGRPGTCPSGAGCAETQLTVNIALDGMGLWRAEGTAHGPIVNGTVAQDEGEVTIRIELCLLL